MFMGSGICFSSEPLSKQEGIGKNDMDPEEVLMEAISIKRLGMACGFTSALLYIGCVLVMWTVGREGNILFFNSLMHGIDVTAITRTDMPWWEMVMGWCRCSSSGG